MCSDKREGSIGVIIVAYKNFFYAPSSATTAVAPLEQAATQNTDEYESVSLSSNASQSVSVCLSRRVYADMRLCALADEDDEEVSEDSSLVSDTASSSYLRAPLPLPFPRRRGIAADPSAAIAGGVALRRCSLCSKPKNSRKELSRQIPCRGGVGDTGRAGCFSTNQNRSSYTDHSHWGMMMSSGWVLFRNRFICLISRPKTLDAPCTMSV